MDPEGSVLVRDDIVFLVRVDRLVARVDVNVLGGEFDGCEGL